MLVLLAVLMLIGAGIFVLLAPIAFFYGLFSHRIREKQTAYLRRHSSRSSSLSQN